MISHSYIAYFQQNVADLELTFSVDEDQMGKIVTHELISGGRLKTVTNENKYVLCEFWFKSKEQKIDCSSNSTGLTTYIIWHSSECIHKFVSRQALLYEVSEAL